MSKVKDGLPPAAIEMIAVHVSEYETAGLLQHQKYEAIALTFVKTAQRAIEADKGLRGQPVAALSLAATVFLEVLKLCVHEAMSAKT